MLRKILIGLGVLVVALPLALFAGVKLFGPTINGPFLDFLLGFEADTPSDTVVESRFTLPEGFRIGIYADGVPHARMMRLTETGDLVVTSYRNGDVILLHRDEDGDGRANGRTVLMAGLDVPHGLAIRDGWLYVAETHRVIRAPFDAAARTVGEIEEVITGLPPGGNHRTRTIGFGPGGRLYTTTGSSCNVCIEDHPWRAAMIVSDADGSNVEVYATGLRNTVGFDWDPVTGNLYGTDNARDLLGDDTPNDELNHIEAGQDYGWPYTFDDRTPDPDFGAGEDARIAASTVMAHGFGGHRAPLGITFLNPDVAPPGYGRTALVALHGSWNSSVLVGYKVVALDFAEDGRITQRDFLTGFEAGGDVIGRPVDIAHGPDGAIYISDDYAGVIYRVVHAGSGLATGSLTAAAPTIDPDPLGRIELPLRFELFVQGAALYAEHGCAACHDPETAAEGVSVKPLDNLIGRHDVPSIVALLKAPPSPMPLFDLTDPERVALAVYVLGVSEEAGE